MKRRVFMVILVSLLCQLVCSPLLRADDAPEARAIAWAQEFERQLVSVIERIRPAYVMIGGGSGVAISSDGWMLTNHHVIGNNRSFNVLMPGGGRYQADVIATDTFGDLALLKLKDAKDIPYLELGDASRLRVGQRVIAIGNPWMTGRQDGQPTVSTGLISALHVYRGNYTDAIQTDAPINPGNSGGPLISMDGKLIGINGQVRVRFGTDRINTGVGYAIPVNQIKRFLEPMQAANGKDIGHGYIDGLGINREYYDGAGVSVARVKAESPAHNAGLRPGDRIMAVDGERVTSFHRFLGLIGTHPGGNEVELSIERGTEQVSIRVPLTLRRLAPAAQPNANPNTPFLGVQVDPAFEGPGVRIAQVIPGGSAEKAGVKDGDILIAVDSVAIESSEQLIALISGKQIGARVKLKIKRDLDDLELDAELQARGNR